MSSIELPGLNCGVCGCKTCAEFGDRLNEQPDLRERCIYLSTDRLQAKPAVCECSGTPPLFSGTPWVDSLGRDFDFLLEHLPEDPGPREVILPHNPQLIRELEIQVGDILIGRPLGMSCGCPVTHCGIVTALEARNGILTWCVTGPLGPREHGFKDLGYYSAQAYEGLVHDARVELRIGMRYFFQPRRCMLQWRHSGLINALTRTQNGYRVRLEGLYIG